MWGIKCVWTFLKGENIFLYRDFSNTETLCSEQKYYCETCCSKQEAQKRCARGQVGVGEWEGGEEGGVGAGGSCQKGSQLHRAWESVTFLIEKAVMGMLACCLSVCFFF